MTVEPTLVVLFRRPAPGIGKQRIAVDIGAVAASEISGRLLECTLEDASDWPGPVVLATAEPRDTDWARSLLARECHVLAQPPGNLGERINEIDKRLRSNGHWKLLFIGSDAPAHNAALYLQACAALVSADVVLVPATDGGVTLMGARSPWPVLIDLPWSTHRLCEPIERLNLGPIGYEKISRKKPSSEKISQCAAR